MSMNTSSVSIVRQINTVENDAPTMSNLNQRELLFQKALTPSDVGKLNRLVIPKQYAEKYFPHSNISSVESSSSSSLLSFEDEMCKIWRFRYSYWISSQSYVLTKGWSLYVKEKGLVAGDIVSFHRQQTNISDHVITDRLFITWRTRLHPTAAVHGDYRSITTVRPHPATSLSISSGPRKLRLFGVNMEVTESVTDQSSNLDSDVSKILNH